MTILPAIAGLSKKDCGAVYFCGSNEKSYIYFVAETCFQDHLRSKLFKVGSYSARSQQKILGKTAMHFTVEHLLIEVILLHQMTYHRILKQWPYYLQI